MSVLPCSFIGLDDDFSHSCEAIQLRLASPGYLDHLEHGRVTVPDTINQRTFRGVPGGLCDHEIFGALADGYEDEADFGAKVEAELAAQPRDDQPTPPHPRRDRFARIELCEPFVHPLFLLRGASWLERRTKLTIAAIRELLAHERHIVIDSPLDEHAPGSTIAEDQLEDWQRELLQLDTGATAIRSLLRRSGHDVDPLIRRVYVLPVQLRPIRPLGRGRLQVCDVNDLYRRVINRNNRLARLHELGAPDIIMRSERAQLQLALDQLFDNRACSKPVTGPGKRPLDSLLDLAEQPALAERLHGLDRWVAEHGYAALERGLPWALFRTWRAIQAMGLELGQP